MRLVPLAQAACVAMSVLAAPATAMICSAYPALDMLARMHAAGVTPVVVTGIVMADPVPVEDPATGMPSLRLDTALTTYAVRVLGIRTDPGGTSAPGQIGLTLDMECAIGFCGDEPDRYQPRVFILWDDGAGLIGYSGVCGGSVWPYRDWLRLPKMRRSIMTEAC